jgi:lipopolysaccharide export LptBFGC system permease protein LptF
LGFGRFIGGVALEILAVLLAILGFAVLLGFFNFILTSYNIPLGIGILIVALFLFVYGWYSYKSGKPQGTIRVEK